MAQLNARRLARLQGTEVDCAPRNCGPASSRQVFDINPPGGYLRAKDLGASGYLTKPSISSG